MVEENQGGRRLNESLRRLRNITLIVCGVALGTATIVYKVIPLVYGDVARATDRSVKEVRKYYSLMGLDSPCSNLDAVIEKIGLPKLEILLKDREIIQRAEKNDDICSEHKISHVIEDILKGYLIYNGDTGRIEQRDSGNFEGIQSIEDYLSLTPEQRELGFFTILASNNYGLTIKELGDIPYKPTVEDFGLFIKHMIGREYSLPLMQQGMKVEDIVQKCATEAGVSVDTRLKYRSIKIHGGQRLSNSEIRVLAPAGMKPTYFEEIMARAPSYKSKVFSLIKEDKLNGQIYVQWRDGGIDPLDTIWGLDLGYSLQFVERAKVLGNNVSELHNDSNRGYIQLLSEIVQQRKAPTQ